MQYHFHLQIMLKVISFFTTQIHSGSVLVTDAAILQKIIIETVHCQFIQRQMIWKYLSMCICFGSL
jgi:hypothetical protein